MNCNIEDNNPKSKIALFVKDGMQNFLKDIYNILSKEFEVKQIIIKNIDDCYKSNGCKLIDDGMYWADICWFEWCDELIEYGSKQSIAVDKKIICRIHSYEVFTDYPLKINWSNVDKIIFVAKHIRDFAIDNYNLEKNKTVIIPNGVNTDIYKFNERQKGFNIAYIGYINYKKGPMLLLQTFKAIYDYDPRYKLYIAGSFQDYRDILYFKQMIKEWHLENIIIYDGWQENLDTWMEDKDYILCTSILESQNISVMQAMCKGIKPIIHNFVGASDIYPKEYLFNTINEAVYMLNNNYDSKSYKDFVLEKYSLSIVSNLIIEEIKEILNYVKPKPLISIIISVYNRAKYVKKAIESVLNQSYKNIEVIIINDGSTDNSNDIIENFKDTRIKYFNNTNRGQLSTLKFGYEKATGDFITRVDSDDFIHEDYVKICLDTILSNPNLQFVYTDFYLVDSNDVITSQTKFNDYQNSIQLLMDVFTEGTSLIPDVAFFKKDYLPNVILNYTDQNVPFYIDNLLNNLYIHIKQPLYFYRQHNENYAKNNDNLKIVIDGNIKFEELLFRRYFIQMNLNGDFLENKHLYFKLFHKYLSNLANYYENISENQKSEEISKIPDKIRSLCQSWLNKVKDSDTNNKLIYLLKEDLNKRLLLVSTDDPLDGRAVGGKHTHIHLLQKGLNENNIPNKLIVSRLESDISVNIKEVNLYMINQISKSPIKDLSLDVIESSKDSSFFYLVYAIQKQLEDKIEKAIKSNYYSVISCQDVIATLAAHKVRERLNFIIPIVSTLHGYFTDENVDYGGIIKESPIYKYFILYEKKAYEVSDKIITVDSRIKDYVTNLNLSDQPIISVLKNAADNISFKCDLNTNISKNTNMILVPRRLVPKNGVIYAVKAASELLNRGIDNFKIVIAGDGIEKSSIQKYIDDNSLSHKFQKTKLKDVIELLGNVPHNEIHTLYKEAKYILIPSIKSNNIEEATSVALLEGMSCGKVVIASAIGGIKEIITDGINGFLVDSANILKLADKLEMALLLTDDCYNVISKNAKNDIEKNYGYKDHAKRFIDMLE